MIHYSFFIGLFVLLLAALNSRTGHKWTSEKRFSVAEDLQREAKEALWAKTANYCQLLNMFNVDPAVFYAIREDDMLGIRKFKNGACVDSRIQVGEEFELIATAGRTDEL